MTNRTLSGCALALVLAAPAALADRQYGIEVEQGELLFMSGQHSAAASLELGRFGAPDYAGAVAHYRKAAVLGYPLAQNSLGRLYELGLGVHQDYVLSHVWYTLAATTGDAIAVANRDASAKRLTPKELLRAQAMARELRRQLP